MDRSRSSDPIGARRRLGRGRVLAIIGSLVAALGCGGDGRDLAPVSGLVTLDGKPLAGASVVCQPLAPAGSVIAGKGSSAFCDADGRFELQTVDGRQGAVVGAHRVRIYGPRPANAPPSDKDGAPAPVRQSVPAKYNHNTELTLSVAPEGTDQANFELVTK